MSDKNPVSLFPLQIDLQCHHCDDPTGTMVMICVILDAINQIRFIGKCVTCGELSEHVVQSPHSLIFSISNDPLPGLAQPVLDDGQTLVSYGNDGVGG